MLGKLKVECGYQFTQKLEGMFHDMRISSDAMEAYREYLSKTTVSDSRISPNSLANAAGRPLTLRSP